MEDSASVVHASMTGNLFESVMKEFKSRVKVVPPAERKASEDNSGKIKAQKEDQVSNEANGIAEYTAYTKRVELPNKVENIYYNTLPVRRNGTLLPSATPPTKPIRRKKPVILNGVTKPIVRRGQLDELRITTDLQDIIDSAFSDIDRRRSETYPFDLDDSRLSSSPEHPPRRFHSLDSDLVRGDSTTSRPSVDVEMYGSHDPVYHDVNDQRLETVSMFSALSNDDGSSNDWLGNGTWSREGYEDSISLSSFTSADATVDSKCSRRRLKAKEKAKLLKKHAAAQKDKVGALLDAAASNASGRFKKMRRKSIKLPKGKTFQNIANKIGNKLNDQPLHTSAAADSQSNASEDENATQKPLLSLNVAPLSSSPGQTKSRCHVQQVAVRSGYLKKQGGMIKTWNERWFVLRGDHLHYFKDVNAKCLGSIFLPGNRVAMHPVRNNDTHKFIFELFPGSEGGKMSSNHESYIFSAASQTDMEEWVKVIRRVILSPFGGGIFGQRLDETMRYDCRLDSPTAGAVSTGLRLGRNQQTPRRQAPIIVENCVEFIRANKGLTEEGLFRLPGQANEVKDLQDSYDMGERPVFPKTTDVHTVASLLKGYLRELPEPVIPFERYDHLMDAARLSQKDDGSKMVYENDQNEEQEVAMKVIQEQLNLLPQPNFDLLRYLCRFLDEVQQHSSINKMDISNLAMVFGPNIMRGKKDDPLTMMTDANNVQHVMHMLIAKHQFFFPDDSDLCSSIMKSLPDVAVDAASRTGEDSQLNGDPGIGTLTTTASPLGTLGLRHVNEDSGTGSLGPTPENTHKRAPPVPLVPPPLRNKPVKPAKPMRKKLSSQQMNGLFPDHEAVQRKSYYDNVSASSATETEAHGKYNPSLTNHDWRKSNESGELSTGQSSSTTKQGSYYVNNRSTTPSSSPRSSTKAVAGSISSPDFSHSSPAEDQPDTRYRVPARLIRRQKAPRPPSRNATDEESNTESVAAGDCAFSTLSSNHSSVHINTDSHIKIAHPRSASYPVMSKYPSPIGRQRGVSDVSKEINRLSLESGSDGGSASIPTVPSRIHRKVKKDDSSESSGSQRNSKSDLFANIPAAPPLSSTNSAATSVSGRPPTYKELEEQIKSLTDEMHKQRLEHEKRSRMLEEHYVLKMRTSASVLAPFTSSQSIPFPPAPSLASHPNASSSSIGGVDDLPLSPTSASFFQRTSVTDDSVLESRDPSQRGGEGASLLSRTISVESQAEMRYRDEVKRHAMTKIRLRNAERGLQQAEERNKQLQEEMEQFFDTFGGMIGENLT